MLPSKMDDKSITTEVGQLSDSLLLLNSIMLVRPLLSLKRHLTFKLSVFFLNGSFKLSVQTLIHEWTETGFAVDDKGKEEGLRAVRTLVHRRWQTLEYYMNC